MSTIDHEKARQEIDDRVFVQQMEQFWKRWAPEDRYEAATFHAELSMLIRQTYRDAQEPLMKQLAAWGAAMPWLPAR